MIPEIFTKGGPLMFVIFACSVVAFSLFFERLYHFRKANVDWDAFMGELRKKVKGQLYMDAITFCSNSHGPLAAVMKSGLLKHEAGRDRIREAMEDASVHEFSRLEKHIPLVAMISHVSPLFGLLGTVLGMIDCFHVIQTKAGLVTPSDLSGGISQALLTTAAGLVVAIPTYLAYGYLVSRIEIFAVQIEKSSTELTELIEDSKRTYKI